MPELLREKKVTARKAHPCMTCNATAIRPGQTYRRETYVNDGRIYDWVICEACSAISSLVFEWADYWDEGIGRDDYVEWAREMESEDLDARAYLVRAGLALANVEVERQSNG